MTVSGVGLHTGIAARAVLKPASEDFGVRFLRTDITDQDGAPRLLHEATISAAPRFVRDTRLGVCLENQSGVIVRTVEHLMAALRLSGIDNALIEIDGPEIPILDGSAAGFMEALAEAGTAAQTAPRMAFAPHAPIRVESGDRFVEVLPAPATRIEVAIDFRDAAIGRRSVAFSLAEGVELIERLARARTFCSLSEVEAMRAAGFALGGSLENAIVVDGGRLLNPAGLRDPDEFALHKALDLIGDLALLGAPVRGHIRAHKPGHDLNTALARRIAEEAGLVDRQPLPVAPAEQRLRA